MTDRRIRVEGPRRAPWLVLSNSLGTTADMWEPQMTALTGRFRVVRYEHRGHGGSATPPGPYSIDDIGGDLLGVLEAVGAERAAVVGLSLGGTAAMWLAAHHPGRVERLVLACTAASWPPTDLWDGRIAAMQHGTPSDLLDSLMARWFTPAFEQGHLRTRRLVASMLEACSPAGYAACCAALARVDLTSRLADIAAPTLVVAAASDPVVPTSTAAALAERVPGAELRVIAPGAHLLNLEQPARFTAAVVDHLAGDPVERGRSVRRAVLGDDHVDRSEEALTLLSAPFSELITRYAWGDIWTRPGLDRSTRSFITLAMLVALGRLEELELHLRGARRNGLTDDEIGEVLLQAAVYCGVPAANAAFAVARRVLAEVEPSPGDGPAASAP